MVTSTSNNNTYQDAPGWRIRHNGANVLRLNDISQTMNSCLQAEELIGAKLEEIKQATSKLCHESHNLSEKEKEDIIDLLIATYSSLAIIRNNLAAEERKCQTAKDIEIFTDLLENNRRVTKDEYLDEEDSSTVEFDGME